MSTFTLVIVYLVEVETRLEQRRLGCTSYGPSVKCAWWDCFRTRVTATLLADRVVRSGCGPLFARSTRTRSAHTRFARSRSGLFFRRTRHSDVAITWRPVVQAVSGIGAFFARSASEMRLARLLSGLIFWSISRAVGGASIPWI